jgi:hypothetical protein
VPGVEGGVNAGDTKPGNSESKSWSSGAELDPGPSAIAMERSLMEREFRSSSEIARETGIGRGE